MALRSSVVAVVILLASRVCASSPQELVVEGNAAYSRQDYEAAMSAYDEASVAAPESAHITFNKGVAHYRQGDYASAKESFGKAALKSAGTHLAARSKFNLGNTAFREFERQQDSDLDKALEACRESVGHYQESLRLDPGLSEAAENIEVVRLVMKSILDKIKEQQEEQARQQQAQQETAEKLKELIEKQESATNQSQALADAQAAGARSDVSSSDLAGEQRQVQTETEQLAADLADTAKTPFPADQVRQHVEEAVGKQDAGASTLEQGDPGAAVPDQEGATEDLREALAALEQGQHDGDKQQQQGDEDSQPQESEPQDQSESASADSSQGDQQMQEAAAPLSEEARDILEEERENAEKRAAQAPGYRAVDRDW